jgi:IS30 family transposase
MNDRPRKTLNWKTPAETFAEELTPLTNIAPVRT